MRAFGEHGLSQQQLGLFAEIAVGRQLFERQGWPTIDVSRRSIEETAAAVINLLAERKGESG